MILTQLIYFSDMTEGVTADDVAQLVGHAHERNRELGLTGFLIYNRRHFMQLIEGGRAHLNGVYARILRDQRHASPILLGYRPVHERSFPDWGMRYAAVALDRDGLYFRFSPQPAFAPEQMSYEGARALLLRMAADAAAVPIEPSAAVAG